jgi:hypothetical protein
VSDTLEPEYHIYKDDKGIIHVEIDEGMSEHVLWRLVADMPVKPKAKRMLVKYDLKVLPF